MTETKKLAKKSFRMEMLGTGVYRGLAKQYKKRNNDLSTRFMEFSDHEAMHGELFKGYFKKAFGEEISGEKLWLAFGSIAAVSMWLLPLRLKLLQVGAVEKKAVADIEKALTDNLDKDFQGLLKKILPHEKAHAGLYRDIFRKKQSSR